jgi:hypothetical protein
VTGVANFERETLWERRDRGSMRICAWRLCSPARWQAGGATLLAVDESSGCWQNHSTMDGSRGAHLPLAKGVRLSGLEARRELDPVPGRCVKVPAEELGGSQIRARKGRSGRLIEEKAGPRAICRGSLNYPPSLTGAPTAPGGLH